MTFMTVLLTTYCDLSDLSSKTADESAVPLLEPIDLIEVSSCPPPKKIYILDLVWRMQLIIFKVKIRVVRVENF